MKFKRAMDFCVFHKSESKFHEYGFNRVVSFLMNSTLDTDGLSGSRRERVAAACGQLVGEKRAACFVHLWPAVRRTFAATFAGVGS